MEPTKIVNGLAMYKIGEGSPVFVMPYPHAATFVSIADDRITHCLLAANRSVITFDPPGAYRSTRQATVDMQEMLACMNETLCQFGIDTPIDLVGHSMGSFCALAYSIHFPEKVNRLVLVGCTSGWRQQKRHGVHKSWNWRQRQFWLLRYWGTRSYLGFSNLSIYNTMNNVVFEASFVDKKHFVPFPVKKGDKRKRIPTRGKWLKNVARYEYHNLLHSLDMPVLICAGKYDVQTPLVMNQQIHDSIGKSRLVVFENSGHFPFVEEKERFVQTVDSFLKE